MTSLSYQNIVDFIRDTANAVNPSGTFVHARKWDVALEYNSPMPQIYLYPFTIKGQTTKEADLTIGFFDQDSTASSNEEREDIIQAMDILQQLFFETLDANGTVELVNLQAEPYYRQLPGTLSGYTARLTLKGMLGCEDTPAPVCGSDCVYNVYVNGEFQTTLENCEDLTLTIG